MSELDRVTLLSGAAEAGDECMKFCLTYEGILCATQGDPRDGQDEKPRRAKMKHEMRRAFHVQLKEHWRTNRFLSTSDAWRGDYLHNDDNPSERLPLAELVAHLHQRDGFAYIPLVREDWLLHCALDVLILRRDHLGTGISAGDLDNRVKSIIDALRMHKNAHEIPGITPQEGETPFYCLLEEDSLVSEFHVRSGKLLEPPIVANGDAAWAKLIIEVNITPYHGTTFNSMFDYA